uniref:Uncharacterized protein n=1 Tax=Clytia hemisphaerica TaxID=252671 RepID=A0A7M5VEH8_9CNID
MFLLFGRISPRLIQTSRLVTALKNLPFTDINKMEARGARKPKAAASKSMLKRSSTYIASFYKNPARWQMVKHTAIFLGAIWVAREFSDIDLMTPPQGGPM